MHSLLRTPGFWLLMAGQSISSFGDIVYNVAVLSFTYASTGSIIGTASIMILTSLVRLLAGFLTVQVVDRLPHRTLMIGADLVRGTAVGILGLLSLRYELGLPAIYTVTAVAACAAAFFTPARSAILPAVVRREHLVRANGLIASAVQIVQTSAWALGAVLVAFTGVPVAILLNAASFLLSAVVTSFIRLVPVPAGPGPGPGSGPAPARRQGPLERLKAGWTEVWSNRVVRDVTIMDSLETFANTIWTSALMLAFTVQVLNAGEEWWGYQGSAYFLGTIIGGVVAAAAANWIAHRGGWMIALSSGSFAILTVWYAFAGNAPLAVALCVAFGPVYQIRDVVQSSMLQASLDPAVMGRAFATREMLLMTLFGPAMAGMSLLADVAGPQAAYLTGAALYGVVAIFSVFSVPIRTYRILSTAS